MIDAGTCAEQIDYPRLPFLLGQWIRRIVNSQLLEGLVDVNYTFGGIDSVKRADQALSHGVGTDLFVEVAPLIDNFSALDDHDRRGVNRICVFMYSSKFFF